MIHRNITVDPSADKFITGITATGSVNAAVGTPFRSGEDWEVPIDVSIIAGAADPTLEIVTVTKNEPYSVTFNAKDLGIGNAAITSGLTNRQSYDDGDFGEDIAPFNIVITPIGNNVFTSETDVLVDINEAAVVTADGSIIALPESQFVASPVLNTSTGAITITISGDFPSMGGQYTLDVNIVGNVAQTETGGATLQNATSAGTSITRITPGISAGGGVGQFRVVADGNWIAEVEIEGGGQTTRTSLTGSFEETYTGPTTGLTFTQRGSISHISGGDGTTDISVTAEPLDYNSNVITQGNLKTYQTINFSGWNVVYRIILRDPDTNAVLDSAIINQNGTFGSLTVVFPGFDDNNLMSQSLLTGASNITFFG